jgi:hypothetical protein
LHFSGGHQSMVEQIKSLLVEAIVSEPRTITVTSE